MRVASLEDMERLAYEVLDRSAVGQPPVDVDVVAEREGLRFESTPMYEVSGAYYRSDPTSGRAFINAREHPLRQRFSKAHELCHHILDAPEISRAAGYPLLQLPTGYRGRESHALHDRFAAALLMPRAWVGEYVRDRGWRLDRRQMVNDVARRFGVSPRAAEVRLEILGHIERRGFR